MEIVPAIDLKDGKCVRLYQGDYTQARIYSEDPVATALDFVRKGAARIHVVDLDGASAGRPVNAGLYERIAREAGVPVQVGGGIRREETASRVLALGVDRVVLGTVAIEEPTLVERLCRTHGSEAVVVSLDARDGMVAVRGWRETSSVAAGDLLERMAALGVQRFVYTDISRDGTLTEPNLDAIARIVDQAHALGAVVISSGGISSVDHLQQLARAGVEAAIVGRALYTGDLTLEAALLAASQ